jgi:tRNA1Val (adenine37-N6)-methyltransferase
MFRFKQFTVIQDKAAMKVCTDSCLFGSLINANESLSILDIGSGTGLLSLMLAQKYPNAKITAVEIDPEASINAIENIENALPLSKNISFVEADIKTFKKDHLQKYDLIISNPPFYQQYLKSPKDKKNIAHHNELLTFSDLIDAILKLLAPNGQVWILLPPFEMSRFESICLSKGLLAQEMFSIKHNSEKPPIRMVARFSEQKNTVVTTEVINIHEKDNKTYSERFMNLLRDYYLIF